MTRYSAQVNFILNNLKLTVNAVTNDKYCGMLKFEMLISFPCCTGADTFQAPPRCHREAKGVPERPLPHQTEVLPGPGVLQGPE